MNNKNFKNNDHESCMEGIYVCLERIETGINELKNVQPSMSNSAVDKDVNLALVQEIKALL